MEKNNNDGDWDVGRYNERLFEEERNIERILGRQNKGDI